MIELHEAQVARQILDDHVITRIDGRRVCGLCGQPAECAARRRAAAIQNKSAPEKVGQIRRGLLIAAGVAVGLAVTMAFATGVAALLGTAP